MTTTRVDEYVRVLVAAAPPLPAEAVQRLRRLLAPARPPADRVPVTPR